MGEVRFAPIVTVIFKSADLEGVRRSAPQAIR
jgi:hypothetical protein